MSNGLAYDSDGGRGFAASITALMTGRGYLQSAKIAAAIGPYDRYAENREAHNNVMRMHRDASYAIPDATCEDEALLAAARETWNEAVALGELYGYRNAQATVLAPTGTISFLMDCDTTGVEPDFSLVKYKELVGGGTMTIVNRTVPMALRTLGYSDAQVEQIEAHINEHGTIVGAPGLAEEHLPVFDVAVGARAISHMGHIKMMGAVQPFLSGAISKCIIGRQPPRHGARARAYPEPPPRGGRGHVPTHGTRARVTRRHAEDRRLLLRRRSPACGRRRSAPATRSPGRTTTVCSWPADRASSGDAWTTRARRPSRNEVRRRLWASEPPSFGDFSPSPVYGCQKQVAVPAAMTEELAFFLGAFAAEGHVSRSIWTIRIANADEDVLARLVAVAASAVRLPSADVSRARQVPERRPLLKTLVEFFDYLGTGSHAASKRIPDAVLASPRPMVLAFLEGLTLDSYLTASVPKWAICLASNDLLRRPSGRAHQPRRRAQPDPQVQRPLRHLVRGGLRHRPAHAAAYHRVALPRAAQEAPRRRRSRAEAFAQSTADVVPGVSGNELYELIPRGRSGRSGRGSGP